MDLPKRMTYSLDILLACRNSMTLEASISMFLGVVSPWQTLQPRYSMAKTGYWVQRLTSLRKSQAEVMSQPLAWKKTMILVLDPVRKRQGMNSSHLTLSSMFKLAQSIPEFSFPASVRVYDFLRVLSPFGRLTSSRQMRQSAKSSWLLKAFSEHSALQRLCRLLFEFLGISSILSWISHLVHGWGQCHIVWAMEKPNSWLTQLYYNPEGNEKYKLKRPGLGFQAFP